MTAPNVSKSYLRSVSNHTLRWMYEEALRADPYLNYEEGVDGPQKELRRIRDEMEERGLI